MEEELDAARERQQALRKQIDTLRNLLDDSQKSIGLAEANTSARAGEPATSVQTLSRASTTSGEIELAGGRSSQAIAYSPRDSSFTGLSSQPVSGFG